LLVLRASGCCHEPRFVPAASSQKHQHAALGVLQAAAKL
jgi:hypothetical protein